MTDDFNGKIEVWDEAAGEFVEIDSRILQTMPEDMRQKATKPEGESAAKAFASTLDKQDGTNDRCVRKKLAEKMRKQPDPVAVDEHGRREPTVKEAVDYQKQLDEMRSEMSQDEFNQLFHQIPPQDQMSKKKLELEHEPPSHWDFGDEPSHTVEQTMRFRALSDVEDLDGDRIDYGGMNLEGFTSDTRLFHPLEAVGRIVIDDSGPYSKEMHEYLLRHKDHYPQKMPIIQTGKQDGLSGTELDTPAKEFERQLEQQECEHDWFDVTTYGDERQHYLCIHCGAKQDQPRFMRPLLSVEELNKRNVDHFARHHGWLDIEPDELVIFGGAAGGGKPSRRTHRAAIGSGRGLAKHGDPVGYADQREGVYFQDYQEAISAKANAFADAFHDRMKEKQPIEHLDALAALNRANHELMADHLKMPGELLGSIENKSEGNRVPLSQPLAKLTSQWVTEHTPSKEEFEGMSSKLNQMKLIAGDFCPGHWDDFAGGIYLTDCELLEVDIDAEGHGDDIQFELMIQGNTNTLFAGIYDTCEEACMVAAPYVREARKAEKRMREMANKDIAEQAKNKNTKP